MDGAQHQHHGAPPRAVPTIPRHPRARRGPREAGQAMVEFAIIMPVFLLIIAGGFSVWQALHGAVNLTSAARAGALVAASDLRTDLINNASPPGALRPNDPANAAQDASDAVNAEEQTTIYQAKAGCTKNCVTLTIVPGAVTRTAEVRVSVRSQVIPSIPGLPVLTVFATATASYEP